MRYLTAFALIVLLASPTFAADLKQQPIREWQDNTGTYRINARLVNADQQTQSVQLQLESGDVVSLPVRRLSLADRSYLNSLVSPTVPVQSVNIAGITWFKDLRDASRAATAGKSSHDDKPILCFRALGDLSGFM